MKFITEEEVRKMYSNAPFKSYQNSEGTRLTPGGRQYLIDKGVKIEESYMQKNAITKEAKVKADDVLINALLTVASNFLKTGVELLKIDVLIAQELFALEEYLLASVQENGKNEPLKCQPCTGINSENFKCSADICFDITGFHAQVPQGETIVKLHCLRCMLKEQETQLTGRYKEDVDSIINRLSQIICLALGGTVCQRKSNGEA